MHISTAEVRCVIFLSITVLAFVRLVHDDFIVTYDPVQQICFEQGMKMVIEIGT